MGNDSDTEGDDLRAVLVDGPLHGELELSEDGSFVYTPEADYIGSDSFTYNTTDGTALTRSFEFDVSAEFPKKLSYRLSARRQKLDTQKGR